MDNYLFPGLVFLAVLFITLMIESRIIPLLTRNAKQPIYAEGPSWHLSKSGTPTMGGIAFVIAITVSLLIVALFIRIWDENTKVFFELVIIALFSLLNALVGLFDDMMKLLRNQNGGLTPIQKLGLQAIIAVIYLMSRRHFLGASTAISLPFGALDLGVLYYPLIIFLILGIVNCANLTDGIDGLASFTALTIGIVFLISDKASVASVITSVALIGGVLGFLFFNTHPARIFMGDTGSLFLGAIAISLALSSGRPLSIIPIGIVYVIEGMSVILQVAIFKTTKKRIFKMAPLHHHLEKCGVSEGRICILAIITTAVFSCLYLLFREII